MADARKRIWAWLARKRLSVLDCAAIALIWVAMTIVQYFTGWNENLVALAVLGVGGAAFCLTAFCHGAWEALRHPHSGQHGAR